MHSALPYCFEWNVIYWGYKRESCCCLSFAHQTDLTPKIFSVVAPCSLAYTHQHFRVPEASIIRVMEAAGFSQMMLHIYQLTVAGPRWQASSSSSSTWESPISFHVTLLEISAKIWLIWDFKFRYLIVVCGHTVVHLVEALRYKPKVTGSIPNGVTGIFHWHNPSCYTMVLGLTKPLTEMSTRNISWGKGGWCIGL